MTLVRETCAKLALAPEGCSSNTTGLNQDPRALAGDATSHVNTPLPSAPVCVCRCVEDECWHLHSAMGSLAGQKSVLQGAPKAKGDWTSPPLELIRFFIHCTLELK